MNPLYIQVAVVALYLVGITVYGVYVGKKESSTKAGYFLGNNSFNWFLIGFSLFATNINSGSVIGESGLASKIGLAASNNELMGGIMLGVSAIFFIPLFLRSRLYTIPEFLEKRFNRVAKLFFSFNFVIQSILATPIGFYAGGLAILHIFGLDPKYLLPVCVVMGVSIGLYSVFGGLTSIVYTDRVQASLLILGCVVIALVGLQQVGGPAALYASSPSGLENHILGDSPRSACHVPANSDGLLMAVRCTAGDRGFSSRLALDTVQIGDFTPRGPAVAQRRGDGAA